MHKNDHQHRSRGFKLINSTSFGESMFVGGFIQKTIKVDLIVRLNHVYPQRKQLKKIPEDAIRLSTKDRAKWLTWGVGWPHH